MSDSRGLGWTLRNGIKAGAAAQPYTPAASWAAYSIPRSSKSASRGTCHISMPYHRQGAIRMCRTRRFMSVGSAGYTEPASTCVGLRGSWPLQQMYGGPNRRPQRGVGPDAAPARPSRGTPYPIETQGPREGCVPGRSFGLFQTRSPVQQAAVLEDGPKEALHTLTSRSHHRQAVSLAPSAEGAPLNRPHHHLATRGHFGSTELSEDVRRSQ